jgi:hypothetical protein
VIFLPHRAREELLVGQILENIFSMPITLLSHTPESFLNKNSFFSHSRLSRLIPHHFVVIYKAWKSTVSAKSSGVSLRVVKDATVEGDILDRTLLSTGRYCRSDILDSVGGQICS